MQIIWYLIYDAKAQTSKENINTFGYIITSERYYEQCEKGDKNYKKFVMHITIEVLVSRIYKEFLQINDKKTNPIEKQAKSMIIHRR